MKSLTNVAKKKFKRWLWGIFVTKALIGIGIFLFVIIAGAVAMEEAQRAIIEIVAQSQTHTEDIYFHAEVLMWRPVVEYWANHYEIDDWVPELLAMMQVETRGLVPDLMQSSESAGLPPNTLEYEDSIAQGVRYLARIIQRARNLELDDDRMAIKQSYNFGIAYLNWLANRGYNHNIDVAAVYSRTVVAPSLGNHTGSTYDYVNVVSIANNRPYLYWNGGNFHYAYLVRHVMLMMVVDGAHIIDGISLPLDLLFVITSPFGPRWGRMHNGIDLVATFGTPVRSVLDGTVTHVVNHFSSNGGFLGHPGGWGNVVFVEHDGGILTIYSHLMQNVTVQVGEQVIAGQVIGFQGNSGSSTGSHLHFEWRENGIPIDPELRIDFRSVANQ